MSPRIATPQILPGVTMPEIVLPPQEGDLQRQVMAYLKLLPGVVAWRQNSGCCPGSHIRMAPEGTPDVIGYLPDGRFLSIELKKPGWRPPGDRARAAPKLSAGVRRDIKQAEFTANASAAGCVSFRALSLEEVASRLAREMGS